MDPNDPLKTEPAVPDPTAPDFAMPADGEAVVAPVSHEVDQDDMFDPMAS